MNLNPLPQPIEVESLVILKQLIPAHRALAELKGVVASIPNQLILLDTLALTEARDSAAIENIISTFDEIYQSDLVANDFASPAAKEVYQYATALKKGFELVSANQLLTNNHILQIQAIIEQNNAGFRKVPGTKLLNDLTGDIVYTPPQEHDAIIQLMSNLERFINDEAMMNADPLVKMAIVHHQFESIHPFYDGNGRTGRIINILYLVQKGLLELPILYLSRYIIKHKALYYQLLQQVRDQRNWEDWILFMLKGVEETAIDSLKTVTAIKALMQFTKEEIRNSLPKIYSQDLVNNLFKYPYTKIELLQADLQISRSTAIRYLESLVSCQIVFKKRIGRDNFYVNQRLFKLLSRGE